METEKDISNNVIYVEDYTHDVYKIKQTKMIGDYEFDLSDIKMSYLGMLTVKCKCPYEHCRIKHIFDILFSKSILSPYYKVSIGCRTFIETDSLIVINFLLINPIVHDFVKKNHPKILEENEKNIQNTHDPYDHVIQSLTALVDSTIGKK